MIKRKYMVPAVLMGLLVISAAAFGASSATYQLPGDVISGGGGAGSSASYKDTSTAGQSTAIGESSSANYKNQGGFWYGAAAMVAIYTTPPIPGAVNPSNTQYGTFVDTPFDLSAAFTDNESDVTACEYCASADGACDTEWAAGTVTGTRPDFTCTKTGITGTNGQTLILNMRAISAGGTGTASAVTRTVDASAPATTDNATSAWTIISPVNVTLTPEDGTGSGVVSTEYCVDITGTCTPATIGTTAGAACAAGSECLQYVRYLSTDNVGNTESIKTSSQIRQDRKVPADGTLTALPDI